MRIFLVRLQKKTSIFYGKQSQLNHLQTTNNFWGFNFNLAFLPFSAFAHNTEDEFFLNRWYKIVFNIDCSCVQVCFLCVCSYSLLLFFYFKKEQNKSVPNPWFVWAIHRKKSADLNWHRVSSIIHKITRTHTRITIFDRWIFCRACFCVK